MTRIHVARRFGFISDARRAQRDVAREGDDAQAAADHHLTVRCHQVVGQHFGARGSRIRPDSTTSSKRAGLRWPPLTDFGQLTRDRIAVPAWRPPPSLFAPTAYARTPVSRQHPRRLRRLRAGHVARLVDRRHHGGAKRKRRLHQREQLRRSDDDGGRVRGSVAREQLRDDLRPDSPARPGDGDELQLQPHGCDNPAIRAETPAED